MASRCRSISRPALTLFKTTICKPSPIHSSSFSHFPRPNSSTSPSLLARPLAQMGALQSLLPLHSAVALARLTSCLGIDSKGCRSLSQENPESQRALITLGNPIFVIAFMNLDLVCLDNKTLCCLKLIP